MNGYFRLEQAKKKIFYPFLSKEKKAASKRLLLYSLLYSGEESGGVCCSQARSKNEPLSFCAVKNTQTGKIKRITAHKTRRLYALFRCLLFCSCARILIKISWASVSEVFIRIPHLYKLRFQSGFSARQQIVYLFFTATGDNGDSLGRKPVEIAEQKHFPIFPF